MPGRKAQSRAVVDAQSMAASEIDQRILGRIAEATRANTDLSSALFRLLGLSIRLSRKLYYARNHELDVVGDVKSRDLCHSLLWLSREGLAIVESAVFPHCQDHNTHGPHCLIMAAKLRASFHHVYCLFRNTPPVSQLSPASPQPSPVAQGSRSATTLSRTREKIPSMVSESASYVTNPFAGPTPPPRYSIPPAPSGDASQTCPDAGYLVESINFVPRTMNYFDIAATLAKRFLAGSDPLRLSIALEQCAFLESCAKDGDSACEGARMALRDVYSAPEGMSDAEFEDASALVQALTAIAQQAGPRMAEREVNTVVLDRGTDSPPRTSRRWKGKEKEKEIDL